MKAKYLIAALAICGTATAEDYTCTNDDGCPARITVDGEVTVSNFRKGDMVSTEAGWVVSTYDGWVKVKTKDRAPNIPPRHQTTLLPMLGDGTVLTLGGRQWIGMPFTGTGGAQGDVYEMSWRHDSDGPGPRQPAMVTVKTERRTGETIREHARRFRAMVDEMQDLFPPNVPETP